MRHFILFLLCCFLLFLAGCGGRKNQFRSGIFNYKDRTVAWCTNKHQIKYAFSLPGTTLVSDSLLITKKNIALTQKIISNGKLYNITATNNLKNGVDHIVVNGQLFEDLDNTYIFLDPDFNIKKKQHLPESLKQEILKESRAVPYPKASDPLFWLILGFTAQLLFTSRMLVQWYSSEKAKKSVMPVLFWYFSVFGSILLLAYAIYRQDPVFILGQSAGLIVYFRNLWLIYKEKAKAKKDA